MSALSVPISGSLEQISLAQSKLKTNPLPRTEYNLQSGRTYYEYYCLMCHGDKGRGDGPVGVSYNPPAADLTSARISSLTDGNLYLKMLYGVGHEPVMVQTVQIDQRWPLVMYVRSLSASRK